MADIRTKLVADISDFVSKMSKAETKAKSSSSTISKSFKVAGAAMTAVAVGVAGVGAAYAGLQAAAEAAANSTNAMTIQLRDTTSKLGIDFDALVGKLQAASYGMVDTLTLMRESNRALLRGLSESQVIRLMEVATVRAEQLGLTVQEAYWRLTSGVAKRERELLDELVTIEHLDVMYLRFAESIGKTAANLTELEKSEALVAAIHGEVIKTGTEVVFTYKNIKESAVDAKNAWQNVKDLGLGSLDTLLSYGKAFASVWRGVVDTIQESFNKIDPEKNAAYLARYSVVRGDITVPAKTEATKPLPREERESIEEVKKRDAFNKAIVRKREEWAKELAEIDQRGAAEKLAALQYAMEQEVKAYGKNATDKEMIERIYQDKMDTIREAEAEKLAAKEEKEAAAIARKAELDAEAAEAREERIAEGMSKVRELVMSDQEQELEELYEHFETMWSLMDLNDERRLESVRIYQEQKAAIEAEYRDKERSDYSTFGDSIVSAQHTMDKAAEKSAANRFGVITGLAQAAMQQGGELGEKAFRLNQGLEIANTIVNTSSAVMKIWAQGGMFAGPMAAAVAAIGAMQVATIASASPGGSSSSSTGSSASMSTSSTNFNTADGITATATTEEDKTGTFTINIMGDIMNEDYVDVMAEKISEAVQDRNVILKASQARTIQN